MHVASHAFFASLSSVATPVIRHYRMYTLHASVYSNATLRDPRRLRGDALITASGAPLHSLFFFCILYPIQILLRKK